MKTRNSSRFLYILFGASFVALSFIYIWEYQTLTSNDKDTADQTRVLWMTHHLDKFQLAFNDVVFSEKPSLINRFPSRINDYNKACNAAVAQIDSLKKLCGNVYVPCDDIMNLDNYLQQYFAFSKRVIAFGVAGNLDSAAILRNSNQSDSVRARLIKKYDEIATHAREDTELFHDRVQNEAKTRYVLLGLLITETLLFFGFALWRMRVRLSEKDIKRKEIEKKLQIVNKAIEQSSASVVITNLQGNIEYVNPAFTKLTGYAYTEVIGQNPRVLKTGHTPDIEYTHLWDNITHKKEWQGEFLNKKKNGETYWEYAVISPITNEQGEITNFVAVKENITERKRLEEEQKHLLTIVENSSAYVFTFDLDRNFLYANKAMKDILELGDADITKYSITQFRSPKAIAVTPEVEACILETGKWTGETAYKTLSGKIVPVIQVFILHKDNDGKGIYVSATGIDITRQKEVENELIHLNKELRVLSKHLQHVREIEKNKIAKEVHDELGQGLASLKLDVAWIKRHLYDDKSVLENKIDELLLSITDKLTAFRKIYTAANTTMIEEIGLYGSIEYLVDTFRRKGKSHVDFSSNIENEKIPSDISLDIYRIVEVSLNGSILYGSSHASLSVYKRGNHLILDITDNGAYLDIKDTNAKSHYSILEIRERVYAMNGQFKINSVPGKGVSLNIEIPLPG